MPRKSTVSKKLKAQIDEQVRKIASIADELLHYSAPRNADVQIFEHLGGVHYKYGDPDEIRALDEAPDESDIERAIDDLRLPRAEDDEEEDEDVDGGAASEPASGLVLQLQADPNPDFSLGSHEASVSVPQRLVPVDSLAEAQSLALAFIAEHDLGSGNWTGGLVLRDGEPYARVSYNGRIWDAATNEELAVDGSKVVDEPPPSEVERQGDATLFSYYEETLRRYQNAAWGAGHYSGSEVAAEYEQAAANFRILLRRRLLERLIIPPTREEVEASFPRRMADIPADSTEDFPEVPAGHWIWRAGSSFPEQEWAGIRHYLEQTPTTRALEAPRNTPPNLDFARGWQLAFYIARQAPPQSKHWPSRQQVPSMDTPKPASDRHLKTGQLRSGQDRFCLA